MIVGVVAVGERRRGWWHLALLVDVMVHTQTYDGVIRWEHEAQAIAQYGV